MCVWNSCVFFFSSRRPHTRWPRDWSSDVCPSDLSDQALVADPHATGPEDVLEALGSSEKGLTADEASARLETYGPNALPTDTQESALKRLLRQLHDPMIYVLIGADVLITVMGVLVATVVIDVE